MNAHCHLELVAPRGPVALGRGFVPWVEGVVASRGRFTPEAVRSATASAIRFLEERGTVAVGDVSNALGHLDLLPASRLSAVVYLELLSWDPGEGGGDAGLAPSSVWPRSRRRCGPASMSGSPPTRRTPCLPRFCPPGRPRRARRHSPRRVARRGGVPRRAGAGTGRASSNGGASRDVAFAPPGLSPVRYADALGVLHPRLVAAHGVQLDAVDREILARRGVHVVLCPRSNRHLGVGAADVPALLASGVRLALGTDSLASAETLDVLDDAVLLHRQFPALDSGAIVRMATLGGAEALGLSRPRRHRAGQAGRAGLRRRRRPSVPILTSFLLSGEVAPRAGGGPMKRVLGRVAPTGG